MGEEEEEEAAKEGAGVGEPMRAAPAASLPPAPAPGRARPATLPRLASPRPGLGGRPRGAGERILPRASPRPAGPPGPPWTEAAAVRAGRGSLARRWGGLEGSAPRAGPPGCPEEPCRVPPVAFGFPGRAVGV